MCFWDTKHAGIFLQIVYEFPKFKCSLLWTYFVPRWDLWNLQTWRQHRAKKSLHMSLQFNLFRISKKIFPFELFKNLLKLWVPSSLRVYFVHRWDLRNLQTERQHRRATLGKESRRQAAQPENIYMLFMRFLRYFRFISQWFHLWKYAEVEDIHVHALQVIPQTNFSNWFSFTLITFLESENIYLMRTFHVLPQIYFWNWFPLIARQKRKG